MGDDSSRMRDEEWGMRNEEWGMGREAKALRTHCRVTPILSRNRVCSALFCHALPCPTLPCSALLFCSVPFCSGGGRNGKERNRPILFAAKAWDSTAGMGRTLRPSAIIDQCRTHHPPLPRLLKDRCPTLDDKRSALDHQTPMIPDR